MEMSGSTSGPSHFTPGDGATGMPQMGCLINLSVSLDAMEEMKSLTSFGNWKLQLLGHVTRSLSLYRLSYPACKSSYAVSHNHGPVINLRSFIKIMNWKFTDLISTFDIGWNRILNMFLLWAKIY
jgi:hypothetical protein